MKNRLKIGDIKPRGWLKEELIQNMEGCIGKLDDLAPGVLRDHDIYGKDRISKKAKVWNLSMDDGEEVEAVNFENMNSFKWWDSESQSNWRDGFVRSSILLEEPKYLEQTRAYVDRILSTQDEDGYLGIYEKELHFRIKEENGEMWSQSSLLRGMLACYEGLKDEVILEKVIMAADCIMKGYPINESHPYDISNPGGGVEHGLTIVDTFKWLYEITDEQKYLDYAVWLYERYSEELLVNKNREIDMLMSNIQNPFYIFQGHAVHTFELIRPLIIAAYAKEEYRSLVDKLLNKLPFYLTPSGAPIGDEMIEGRTADADRTGYEFCSVHELLHSYSLLAEKSGDMIWNDYIEWLYYNAAEGMKHPVSGEIMYCKLDNCYTADKRMHPRSAPIHNRFMYSPTHQKVALCCVPNMGRITPYFIQSMLQIKEDGFQAAGYGPYVYEGEYNDVQVSIEQDTKYPMEMHTTFHIKTSSPTVFSLHLRLPAWAKQMTVNGKAYENLQMKCDEIIIRQEWSDDIVNITFEPEIQFKTDFNHNVYVTRGPLLYVLPLPSSETIMKEMPVKGFYEKCYSPVKRELEKVYIRPEDFESFEFHCNDEEKGWKALRISGNFTDSDENKYKLDLVPMARTILRKTTFRWPD